jgi:hypothetical protein
MLAATWGSAFSQEVPAANKTDKPGIWEEREVTLPAAAGLTPVVVGIWDGGTDVSLFPGRVFVNPKEIPGNGLDDDANGYIDDVNGIGWSWNGEKNVGPLRTVRATTEQLEKFKPYSKGSNDLEINLDSPEARALKRHIESLPKEAVIPFFEDLGMYYNFAHGTHVAGIVARGNPAIRLLVARMDFPFQYVFPLPTAAWANRQAIVARETIAYFRQNGVRVVNMSWGYGPESIERALAQNGADGNEADRVALAFRIFDIVRSSFERAMSDASEILFVSAVGNGRAGPGVSGDLPSSFDLPNTIAVGAVDPAGEETTFTSFGKVDLYANGYEVESVLPGGDKQKWSGTSMASPQVANLAAKLLAVFPALTTVQLRGLIIDGCDEKVTAGNHRIKLLNEKRAFDLAREKFSAAGACPGTIHESPAPSPEG